MTARFRAITAPIFTLALTSSIVHAGDGPMYEITILETPAGQHSQAWGISPNGTIAGRAGGAVIWNDVGRVPLGVPQSGYQFEARAVNDAGQVACVGEGNPQSYVSYLWDNGAWTELGTLPGLPETIVDDIDGLGRIVGRSFVLGPGDPDRAFVWQNGSFTELGTLGDSTVAFGINELGQVAGRTRAMVPGGSYQLQGFLWDDGAMTGLLPLENDIDAQSFDINDAGDIVGSSWSYTSQFLTTDQATLWRDHGREVVDLGVVPAIPGSCSQNPYWHKSIARAINNNDVIVGEAMCIGSGAPKAAFVWMNGTMYNLNFQIEGGTTLDLRSARDINDGGQIVGYGVTPDSQIRAFLLTPIDLCPADINGDNTTNVDDLILLLAEWGPCGACPSDINNDGTVNVDDLTTLLAAWGPCS